MLQVRYSLSETVDEVETFKSILHYESWSFNG